MDVFNIKVAYHGDDITLTVAKSAHEFRIIYNGGIIGAIRQKETDWEWLPEDEITPGELPLLSEKQGFANEKLPLGLPDINHIVAAIENHLSGQ